MVINIYKYYSFSYKLDIRYYVWKLSWIYDYAYLNVLLYRFLKWATWFGRRRIYIKYYAF